MNKEELEKLSSYIEQNVIADVDGIREDGDYTDEGRKFPDTWYHCGLESEYNSAKQEISFCIQMIADRDFVDEFGFGDEYENSELSINYDIYKDDIIVETYTEEEDEFMNDILSDLEYKIQEDEALHNHLRNVTAHLRVPDSEGIQEENPNLIWDGTKSCICDFTLEVNNWGYKYLVKCFPLYDDLQEDLGAACWDDDKLIQQLRQFTEAGYSCQVQLIDNEYIKTVKKALCPNSKNTAL